MIDITKEFTELAFRSGNSYYIKQGTENVLLGSTKIESMQKLSRLLNEGKVISDSDSVDTGKPVSGTLEKDTPAKTVPQVKQIAPVKIEPPKSVDLDIDEILGTIRDVNPDHSGSVLDIFIDGVNSKLINNRAVKNCPLSFYWMKKIDNIGNGAQLTNNEYTVFKREWADKFKVTVSRDDDPSAPFFIVAELILCCCKRDDYNKRQALMVARNTLRSKVDKETRNQFTREMAKNSNIEQVESAYGEQVSSHKAEMQESMIANKGMSASEAARRLESMSPEKALEFAVEQASLDDISKY